MLLRLHPQRHTQAPPWPPITKNHSLSYPKATNTLLLVQDPQRCGVDIKLKAANLSFAALNSQVAATHSPLPIDNRLMPAT